MPFKDPEKEREWRRKYVAAHHEQRKATQDRYRERHHDKILAYGKEYTKRPDVIERRRAYYLENRTEMLANSKRNKMMKGYKPTKQTVWKRRKSSRDSARRKRCGICIQRNERGYFWKSGKISNGPFNYMKEAIKDAEKAFLL